jgi:hypothetical protein
LKLFPRCLSRHLCVALPSSLTAVERLPTEQTSPCLTGDLGKMRDCGAERSFAKPKLRSSLHRRSMLSVARLSVAAMRAPRQFRLRVSVPTIIRRRKTLPDGLDSLSVCHSAKPCDSWWLFSPGANYAKPADPVNLAPAAQWREPCAGALSRAAALARTSSGTLPLALSAALEASKSPRAAARPSRHIILGSGPICRPTTAAQETLTGFVQSVAGDDRRPPSPVRPADTDRDLGIAGIPTRSASTVAVREAGPTGRCASTCLQPPASPARG